MPGGWTGGQYSAWRIAVGITSAAVWFALAVGAPRDAGAGGAAHAWIFRALGGPADEALRAQVVAAAEGLAALAGVALAVGRAARAAALVLAVTWLALAPPTAALAGAVPAACAWLVHALPGGAPFGSLAAAGRVDPGGGWRLPAAVPWFAAFALGALAWRFSSGSATPGDTVAAALLVPGVLRPAWFPPRDPAATERVFYDGTCGLCHRFVRFALAEDARGTAFRFAPLGGEAFRADVPEECRAGLPDSLVVRTAAGELLVRSRAARHVLARLGGLWRLAALATAPVPRALADAAYDAVARARHRLFAPPARACPLLPPELAERFDP